MSLNNSGQKRILITGAAGFLGSHLSDRFIKEGYHVIGMDNLITGSISNIEHLFPLKEFEFYFHDVTKFVHVPGKLDYILHFASPASPIDYLKIPIQTLQQISCKFCGYRTCQRKESKIFNSIHFGNLRRSAGSSAERRILGKCKPNRSQRRL